MYNANMFCSNITPLTFIGYVLPYISTQHAKYSKNSMNVYSENCTRNIVNNNKTQYKHARLATTPQATMIERGKFEFKDLCVNLRITHF